VVGHSAIDDLSEDSWLRDVEVGLFVILMTIVALCAAFVFAS
jgi:hypothetical protein